MRKKILICGAGGFIGSHLAERLRSNGDIIFGADLKHPEFFPYYENFFIGDLRDIDFCKSIFRNNSFHQTYQLAADMGGAEYIFGHERDYTVMSNSVGINLNISKLLKLSSYL